MFWMYRMPFIQWFVWNHHLWFQYYTKKNHLSVRPWHKNTTKKAQNKKETHDSHISNWTPWAKWSSETLKKGRDKPTWKQRLKGRWVSVWYLPRVSRTHPPNWAQRSGKHLPAFSRCTISSWNVFDIKAYFTLIFKVKFLAFKIQKRTNKYVGQQIQRQKQTDLLWPGLINSHLEQTPCLL